MHHHHHHCHNSFKKREMNDGVDLRCGDQRREHVHRVHERAEALAPRRLRDQLRVDKRRAVQPAFPRRALAAA